MSAPLLLFAIDIAAVVCAALLCATVLISRPRLRSAQLIALIAFGTVCAVLLGHQDYGPWMPSAFRLNFGPSAEVLNLARNVTPGAMMLLSFELFTEQRRFPGWLSALFALQLCCEGPARWLVPSTWPYVRLVEQDAPALLQTLFVGAALFWTAAEWSGDLVEARRRARAVTLGVVGLLTATSVLLTRVVIDPDNPANYAVHVALTATYLGVLTVVLLRLTRGNVGRYLEFAAPAPAPTPPPARAANNAGPALTRLRILLEDERVCEEEGLSLKALADRVGLPEYRLRKLIHEQLGYRNFNALLHHYRIREACRRLGDPGERRTPILTIALSVGYAAVNTFSRGFREVTGVTPSAYREERLSHAADRPREGG